MKVGIGDGIPEGHYKAFWICLGQHGWKSVFVRDPYDKMNKEQKKRATRTLAILGIQSTIAVEDDSV